MIAEVHTACVVCGDNGRRLLCTADELRRQFRYLERFHRRRLRAPGRQQLTDRADFTQDYITEIVRCASCGLVFRETRPRAEAITRAYAHDHYGAQRLEALFLSQVELFRGKLDALQRLLAPIERPVLVEVGSFVGGFLAAARERGWRVTGIDPGEEVDAFCRRKGLDLVRATVDDAPIQPESVDGVVIWNTFDQLPHPHATLNAVAQWLRPHGLLVIRIPNGACFASTLRLLRRLPSPLNRPLLAAMVWNNLLGFPYLFGYSVETLARLLRSFDLHPERVQGDTLVRLADDTTKPWAAWEERLIKAAWQRLARAEPRRAPWLDLYYRRTR